MAGKGGGLGRDTFHQIAITDDRIGVMIDDFKAGAIVAV